MNTEEVEQVEQVGEVEKIRKPTIPRRRDPLAKKQWVKKEPEVEAQVEEAPVKVRKPRVKKEAPVVEAQVEEAPVKVKVPRAKKEVSSDKPARVSQKGTPASIERMKKVREGKLKKKEELKASVVI